MGLGGTVTATVSVDVESVSDHSFIPSVIVETRSERKKIRRASLFGTCTALGSLSAARLSPSVGVLVTSPSGPHDIPSKTRRSNVQLSSIVPTPCRRDQNSQMCFLVSSIANGSRLPPIPSATTSRFDHVLPSQREFTI